MRLSTLTALGLIACQAALQCADGAEGDGNGRLQTIREETSRDPAPRQSEAREPRERSTSSAEDIADSLEFAAIFIAGFMVFDTPAHPYADGHGWQRRQAVNEEKQHPLAIRGRLSMGVVDSDLWYWGGEVDITTGLYEFHLGWDRYHESQATGSDHLGIGTLEMLVAAPIVDHRLRFGIGGGFSWIEGNGSASGGHFSALLQAFPKDPLLIESRLSMGAIGSARAWRWRSQLGVQWSHFSLAAGYDLRHIGSTNLSGPLLSVSVWF